MDFNLSEEHLQVVKVVRDYEYGRMMTLKVGWMKKQGIRNTKETSLLKWYATDVSFEAANEAHSDPRRVRLQRRIRCGTLYAQQPRCSHIRRHE